MTTTLAGIASVQIIVATASAASRKPPATSKQCAIGNITNGSTNGGQVVA